MSSQLLPQLSLSAQAFQLPFHRPLPEELLEYARIDTHYLLYIAEQLRNHLTDRGLMQPVLERSRQLCLRVSLIGVLILDYLDLYPILSLTLTC